MKHRRNLRLATSAAVLGLCMPAYAQGSSEPAQESFATLEEIVVTAQRRVERIQDTPISMQALSAESLADRGVVNLKSITNFVPNVDITNGARTSSGGSSYGAWIRGVGSTDYAFPTDPGVGLYVDGVYLARTLGGLLSVADIERIEVLRGPQGTLYGRNTIGGAVNIVTQTPSLEGPIGGMVQGRLGSYGRADVIASINGPLVEDQVGFKLSASYFSGDGWGHRPQTGERLNGEDRFIVRGGILAALGDDVTLDVRADYSRQRNVGSVVQMSGGLPIATPANIARYNNFAAPVQAALLGLPAGSKFDASWALPDTYSTNSVNPMRDDYDIGGISATLEWNLADNISVKSITAYRGLETHIQTDGDNSPFRISSIDETVNDDQFNQEFQVGGDLWDERLTFLAGAYYFYEKGDAAKLSESFHGVYQVTGLNSDARDTLTFQRYKAESFAFFTQEELKLGGGVSAVLGARINKDIKDYGVQVQLPERGNVVQVPSQTRSASWTSFTPKVGLNWKVAPDALLYASYSTGFKSGGFSNPTATYAAPVYDPEKLKTFEVGAKAQFLDRRLTANFAGFYTDWSDIQLSVQVPGPTGGIVNLTANGGTAEIYGFEGEIVAYPIEPLRLNFNIGYTSNKFTDLAPGAITAGITYDTKLPHVPKWTIAPGIQYDLDSAIGSFRLRTDLAYRSSQFMAFADARSFQEGYTLLSARLSFEPAAIPGLEVAVEGTNLTNKRYYTIRQSAPIFGVGFQSPGDPRLINATATIRF